MFLLQYAYIPKEDLLQKRNCAYNNGFKVRLASKDVIGDLSRHGTNNNELWNQDERNGRKCWVSGPVSILTG